MQKLRLARFRLARRACRTAPPAELTREERAQSGERPAATVAAPPQELTEERIARTGGIDAHA
jgi:hypothetical protein